MRTVGVALTHGDTLIRRGGTVRVILARWGSYRVVVIHEQYICGHRYYGMCTYLYLVDGWLYRAVVDVWMLGAGHLLGKTNFVWQSTWFTQWP